MGSYEELLVEKHEKIAFVTLDRPDRGNALTASLLGSIHHALHDLEEEGGTLCVVLQGAGEKGFSVGMDLYAMSSLGPEESVALIGKGGPLRRALAAVESFPYPVIAMIRGNAAGAACELTMACDIRVGARSSLMGMPPAKLGMVYPPEGVERFVRILGLSSTRKLFYTARYFNAVEARDMGMLDYLVPDGELEAVTVELAKTITSNAPLSQAGHKSILKLMNRCGDIDSAGRAEIDLMMDRAMKSEDAAEAYHAFDEKRPPRFKGQ